MLRGVEWGGVFKEIIVLYTEQPSITGTLLVKLHNVLVLKWEEDIKSARTILGAMSE